jgi:DNA primase
MDPLAEIKRKLDLVEFINQRVPLQKAGRNFKACCPFHSEKSPSFVVSPDRQIWHCFGSCNEGGDIFKFLMKWENLSFGEALKVLADQAGVELKKDAVVDQKWQERQRYFTINQYAADFYQFLLEKHKLGEKSRAYLESRKVNSKTSQHFGLGYAPRSWDSLFKYLSKKGYGPEEMAKAGLVVKTDSNHYYDRFRSRLMFPLTDMRGNILGFSGRLLTGTDKMEAKYLNTPETAVYHKRQNLFGLHQAYKAIKDTNEVLLVEGEFDAILAHQFGYKQTVAIKGSALTQDHLYLIKRLTNRLIFALDMDEAGQEAIHRSISEAEKFDFEMSVIMLKGGKDPAELLSEKPQEFEKDYQNKQTVYEYLIESNAQKLGLDSIYRKKELVETILPYLARIQNPILVDHYLLRLAEKTGIALGTISKALANFARKRKPLTEETETEPKEHRKMEEGLETYLIALLVQTNKQSLILERLEKLEEEDYYSSSTFKLFEMAKEIYAKNPKEILPLLGEKLPGELLEGFNKAFLWELPESDTDWEKEVEKTILNIKKYSLRRQIKVLMQSDNEDKLGNTLRELKEVEKALSIM